MRYKPNRKMGGGLLFLLTVLFGMLLVTKRTELFQSGRDGLLQALVLALAYLLAAGLIYWKYWLFLAIRIDEQSLTVERLFMPDLHVPFQSVIRVTYRGKERRSAAGLMIERREDQPPQFLLLSGFEDEERDKLRTALAERLGVRFREDAEVKS